MIKTLEGASNDALMEVADLMVAAAKTAPKASGQDKVVGLILTGEDIGNLSKVMEDLGKRQGEEFIIRDSKNILECPAVVLLGVESAPLGLGPNCQLCGFKDCSDLVSNEGACVLNITDLGIAIGSAVSIACNHRIDNRVMYSVGKAALESKLFPKEVKVCYGIPLYIGSKNIFFDRGPGSVLK